MKKIKIISINDRDKYFQNGFRNLLEDYFFSINTSVRFIGILSIENPDIIINIHSPGDMGGVCNEVLGRDPQPYYFSIRDKKQARLSYGNSCTGISAVIYRHQGISEVLSIVRDVTNSQITQRKNLPVCSVCHHRRLSIREREVLFYLNSGLNQTQTAKQMRINVKTVSSHKRSAMKKLNIKHNIALMHWMLLGGLHGFVE